MTTATNIIITMILFGMVITGITVFWGDMNNNYGLPLNDNFSKTLNVINQTTSIVNNMNSMSQGQNSSSLSTTEVTWYDSMQQQIYGFTSALKLMWNIPALIKSVIDDLSLIFGLPAWFTIGILAILIIIVLAAIYLALTGRLF